MCQKRLKRFLLSLVLCSLLPFVPSFSYSYADVTLTDSEAQELMNEIQESQKDLTELKEKLQTAETNLESAETQLSDVKSDCEEQKKSYETQLKEVKKQKTEAVLLASGTTASTIILAIVLLVCLL